MSQTYAEVFSELRGKLYNVPYVIDCDIQVTLVNSGLVAEINIEVSASNIPKGIDHDIEYLIKSMFPPNVIRGMFVEYTIVTTSNEVRKAFKPSGNSMFLLDNLQLNVEMERKPMAPHQRNMAPVRMNNPKYNSKGDNEPMKKPRSVSTVKRKENFDLDRLMPYAIEDAELTKTIHDHYNNLPGYLPSFEKLDRIVTPEKIITNGRATIVMWKDGTKTIVKAAEGEELNTYTAFTAALAKKIMGSTSRTKKIVSRCHVAQVSKDSKKETLNSNMNEGDGKDGENKPPS